MIVILVTFIASCLASTPLFSERELKEIQYLKSPKRFFEMRKEEFQQRSNRQVSFILKMISEGEKKVLEKKVNDKYWKNFDEYTDNQLRIKIMTDLILKDLYKEEGK